MVIINRLVEPTETKVKMTTQVVGCFSHRVSMNNNLSKVSNSESDFDGVNFKAPETDTETRPVKIKTKPTLKKFPSVTKLKDRDCSVNTKVCWDEGSLAETSVHTNKPTAVELDSKGRRRHGLLKSDPRTSYLEKTLKKCDDDLQNILMNQSIDLEHAILAVNGKHLHKIKPLGRGMFCTVTSVAGALTAHLDGGDGEQGARQSQKRQVYALKAVDMKRVKKTEDLIVAATDLASEAMILAELDHKNIIKLRGLSCETFSKSYVQSKKGLSRLSLKNIGGSFVNFASSFRFKSLNLVASMKEVTRSKVGESGYFLLLDVLTEVLSDRLTKERRNIEIAKRRDSKNKFIQTKEEMYSRIQRVVMGIVEGMQYLHSHDIVLRDLKPGNVGFDDGTNVRLFDFGMARKLSNCNANEICGSPRYMAPEILGGEGYTLKVDVYSFGIMLYELCTLEVPFSTFFGEMKKRKKKASCLSSIQSIFNSKPNKKSRVSEQASNNENKTENEGSPQNLLLEFYRRVCNEDLRPSDNLDQAIPCEKMGDLIKDCWNAEPHERPSFDDIRERLEAIFNS